MGAIATTLGGVVNLEPGAYVALAGTLIGWIGARSLPYERPETTPADPEDTGYGQFKHNLGNRWETYKGAFTTGTAAPAKTLPRTSKSSSSPSSSPSASPSSPTASPPSTTNSSSASSSPQASASRRSRKPDSSSASPPSRHATAT